MLRSTLTCVLALSALAVAHAQPPQVDPEAALCPRDALTIYFARGDASPSEQARVLIARIGADAVQCRPDAIDIVTGIDTAREGDSALSLAMARLHGVADALVAGGVPAERIRVAAQGGSERLSPMGEITVLFRNSGNGADDVAAPSRPATPKPPRDAI